MIDIDLFKEVNDEHGHPVGDRVLADVAHTLATHIRKTDHVARYGGEEFCVLFTDVDEDTAGVLAENLRVAIAAIDGPPQVTACFGVCSYSRELQGEMDAVVRAADAALYLAKRAGRNRVMGR